MAIRVEIPSPLRPLTGGASQIQVEAASVAALIEELAVLHRGLKERLCEPTGELRAHVRIFVNDEDIRFLQGKQTPLAPGDTVAIVPAIAGGQGGEGPCTRGHSS